MEPQVQYAKTSDGVSIAYWTLTFSESHYGIGFVIRKEKRPRP